MRSLYEFNSAGVGLLKLYSDYWLMFI